MTLQSAFETVRSLDVGRPWALLLLALIPLCVRVSYRSLAGLGSGRRWTALGLRCLLILLLTLAVADLRLRHQNDSLTVLFLVDRSLSVPEEYPTEPGQPQVDRRWERVKRFINDSVRERGPARETDKVGVIVFGRYPRLELPPSDAPRLNFTKVDSVVDSDVTDIGAAIKLALASFPEGTGKRIVLISDGNENLGNAEEQTRLAALNGVQLDVVPLGAGERKENEVMVQSVEAQPQTDEQTLLVIRVLLRNLNPKPVVGLLSLSQVSEGKSTLVVDPPPLLKLEPGLNSIPFKQRLGKGRQSYTYQAVFEPKGIEVEPGRIVEGLPGDRWQNNRAGTHVVSLGQRRILFVEEPPEAGKPARHSFLIDHLRHAGAGAFRLDVLTVDRLPQEKAELGIFLSNYDSLILADVAADWFTEQQQEMIRSNTHDQGCGLVVIGGKNSFGAGGWQGTAVEKALPVDTDIKSMEVEGKGGLVLVMHASEMANGNRWQKEIAKLAVKKLSTNDEVGVLYYDWGNVKWHVDLQRIRDIPTRDRLLATIDTMSPGDMPDFDPFLLRAHQALIDPAKALATKHVIIISDGDPVSRNPGLLAQMRTDKVTVTTVGVATHGAAQDQAMKAIADATGGRYHSVKNPAELPAIYIKETRLVSRSFVVDKPIIPTLRPGRGGPADNLPDPLPRLHGFVRTTPKPSLLVETPIETPGDQKFPILAYWQYGLGRAVVFTSDARSSPDDKTSWWDREWAASELYTKFWEQVVAWSLRPTESGRLLVRSQFRDGMVKLSVDTHDLGPQLEDADVQLEATVTAPSRKPGDGEGRRLVFQRKSAHRYEAEFKAEEAGSYFLNAHLSKRVKAIKDGKEVWGTQIVDSTRAGVTVPYSLEFAEMDTNSQLLERLRDLGGGRSFADTDAALAAVVREGAVFRRGLVQPPTVQPVWPWLLFATAVGLLFDVAVRRIAFERAAVTAFVGRCWDRLRGRRPLASTTPEYFERLQSRKATVGESLEQTRATRRFEASEPARQAPSVVPETPTATPKAAPPKPTSPPPSPAGDTSEGQDFASRLLKAKKKVWEERDKEKG